MRERSDGAAWRAGAAARLGPRRVMARAVARRRSGGIVEIMSEDMSTVVPMFRRCVGRCACVPAAQVQADRGHPLQGNREREQAGEQQTKNRARHGGECTAVIAWLCRVAKRFALPRHRGASPSRCSRMPSNDPRTPHSGRSSMEGLLRGWFLRDN